MWKALRDRYHAGVQLLRRRFHRPVRECRRRLETTSTLVHVSILLFVPFLVGLLTYLSTRIDQLSFFLFPPLAAGTYALFAHPQREAASPARFVAGLTAGAICAWVAMAVAVWIIYPDLPPTTIEVDAPGAAFAVFLTGVVTWVLDIEEAAAFSTALLGLLVDPARQGWFVASVFVSSSIVAIIFAVWRDLFYEQRARYLYESTKGGDRVLVPMHGTLVTPTAMLAGGIAAANDAGKVVLLDIVEEDWIATAERTLLRDGVDSLDSGRTTDITRDAEMPTSEPVSRADSEATAIEPSDLLTTTVTDLEQLADQVETAFDIPCEVIVAASSGSPVRTVRQTASKANCDLIAVPYEVEDGELTSFVERLLQSKIDILVHRSYDGRTNWQRITVPVRRAGDTAHHMIEFACRLAGSDGHVSVAHCINAESQRRAADKILANLVETADYHLETHVARAPIERFLHRVGPTRDLVIVGASRDRSAASRVISPPTFERIDDLETDLAIVARR